MFQDDIFVNEIQRLRSERDGLGALVVKKDERIKYCESEITYLNEIIKKFQRTAFGATKERWTSEEQLVFNEAEVEAKNEKPEDLALDQSDIEVEPFTRKRGKRKPLPGHLPREIVLLELPEEERFAEDGTPLKAIGKEKSEKLVYEPAKLSVVEYHRVKYGVECGDFEKTAPAVPSVIPKGIGTPSLFSGVITNKFVDGLPFYRQEEMFKRVGVDLPRSTQARWVVKCAEALIPIRNCLEERLLNEPYVQCDETTTQVLKEKGRTAESQSYMWVRSTPAADKKVVLFDYDPSRAGAVALRLFEDYQGTVQSDGYAGYGSLEKMPGITRLGCNMHGRRYFFDASEGAKEGQALATTALLFYQKLYQVEEDAREITPDERHKMRLERSVPLWTEFKAWSIANERKVPPKSKIGKAFHYFREQHQYLIGYLQSGVFEMDSGFVERMIRKFAIGRNNWLFSDTEAGAEASSLFYSLVITAKINGVNPYAALKSIFEQIPSSKSIEDYERLADLLLTRSAPA